MEYETLSNNEMIMSLWSPSAIEKCRLGLADCVLFENGSPHRWYVTGSAGEVKLKRQMDLRLVSQRWLKISEQFSTSYVAVVKQQGGILKFLTREAWVNFTAEAHFDSSLSSVHCFLGSGTSCNVYRSTYVMNMNSRRWKISTQVYNVPFQEPLYVLNEEKISFTDSRASSINKVTDLATTTAVRYVEKMLRVQIARFVVDYIIDQKSQIWLLWSSDVGFYRSIPVSLDFTESAKHSSPTSRVQTPASPSHNSRSLNTAETLSNQLQEMAQSNLNKKDPKASQISNITATHSFASYDELSSHSNFPNPFKCKGDFCNLEVNNAGQLAVDDKTASLHFAKRFFSDSEIQRLRRDPKYHHMISLEASDTQLLEISMKSILLARKDKRGTKNSGYDSSWFEYPTSPGGKGELSVESLSPNRNKTRSSVWVSLLRVFVLFFVCNRFVIIL